VAEEENSLPIYQKTTRPPSCAQLWKRHKRKIGKKAMKRISLSLEKTNRENK